MKTNLLFIKTNEGVSVEIDNGSMKYRHTFASLLPADFENLQRAFVFVAQNCAAHRFSQEVIDRRNHFLNQESDVVVQKDKQQVVPTEEFLNLPPSEKLEVINELVTTGSISKEDGLTILATETQKEGDSIEQGEESEG